MAYLPELHYCCMCKKDLGPDDGDGICYECDYAEAFIMDGRAHTDAKNALVLEACESISEAIRAITDYAPDSVIATFDENGEMEIVGYHPEWKVKEAA